MAGISSDVANSKAVAVNVRKRGVIGNAEQHPSLQDDLQLFPAGFQRLGIRPDGRDRGDMAIERPVIPDVTTPDTTTTLVVG